jgi:hypothetical protein
MSHPGEASAQQTRRAEAIADRILVARIGIGIDLGATRAVGARLFQVRPPGTRRLWMSLKSKILRGFAHKWIKKVDNLITAV